MTHEEVIRAFLKDHPEHIMGVIRRPVGGKEELCFDTPTLKAFVDWSIRTKRGDPEKTRRFRAWLDKREQP